MLKRFLLYGFPVYLVIIEQLVKFILDPTKPPSYSTSAPTIAAAGLTLLVPVIIPKPVLGVTDAVRQEFEAKRLALITQSDQRLINSAWIFVLVLALFWGCSLYLAEKTVHVSATWAIGLVCYAIGVLHTEIKEVV